jgi:cell division septation protein DedD
MLAGALAACTSGLETRVSGNLGRLVPENTVAILPVETVGKGDGASGRLLRKNLYANLIQSPYRILEPYVVDSLLKKRGMTNPATYSAINPMEFGEVLGVDAVLISRLNHVERSYLLLHSSIELSVSLQMVDTRTGEILWRADQTESDYQGIGKIPTGILSALFSPIYFVTNKFNLGRMTSKVAEEITETVRRPEMAKREKKFRRPLIASASVKDLERIRNRAGGQVRDPEVALLESPLRMLTPMSQSVGPVPLEPSRAIGAARDPEPAAVPGPPEPKAPEPAEPPAMPEKASGEAVHYTIQVGAYRDQDSAVKIIRALARKGYRAVIVPFTAKDATLYRVHVEQFEQKEQAVELAERLRRREHMQNFITIAHSG